MKNIKKSYPLFIILLLILLAPQGLVFAGTVAKLPFQTDNQTATPTVTPTAAPIVTPTPAVESLSSPSLDFFQVPGLLPTSQKIQLPDTTDTFTFEQFGLSEVTMRGPFASQGYYFDLPVTWSMKDGANLQLSLDIFYTGANALPTITPPGLNLASNYIGTLEIQYNYTTIGTVDLVKEGHQQVDIPIPLSALNHNGNNQGHSITLILDSGINCNLDSSTTVIVRAVSQLYLPHDLIAPPVDLRLLPAPFFQNSFNQNAVVVIVPNQPTAKELQAAFSVAAGLGRMTYNDLLISLIPVSQATKEILASTNLIFVGKAKGLPLLQQVSSLPASISNGTFVAKDAASTDGIVQLALSPWNATKVIMVVGGNEDTGVVNAANAVSSGLLQVGSDPGLSLVSNVRLTAPVINPTDLNRTFADLGYDSMMANQIGLSILNYKFTIPQNYIIGTDAYLNLNFSHSSLLEYQRSTIVVNLNGQLIGSVRLSDETAGQGNAKVFLPASATRPGVNDLSLEINLEPLNQCVTPLLNGMWLRVDPSSSLHLSFVPNFASTSTLIDLEKFPFPFSFDPLMKDLAFVVSENDPVGWNVSAQLAAQLGNAARVQVAGLEVFYSDAISDVAKQERNLIIVGKPSKLPIISELANVLPAPFEANTDIASGKNLQISYRIEPGVDVGYVELLSAPWNSSRNVLYIGGSSDLGVRWAGAALQFGRLRSELKGNLAFISGEQVISTDTRIFQESQDILPLAIPTVGVTSEFNQQVTFERPGWILPAIFVTLGAIVLVLIILGVQLLFRKRQGK